jgi:hypothetical protein
MGDALSRNVPKLSAGEEMLLALCLAHGRRQFVDVAANFPVECRYVLERLGEFMPSTPKRVTAPLRRTSGSSSISSAVVR